MPPEGHHHEQAAFGCNAGETGEAG
uniref:Uncharacterized protein n=1 Tax=Arundo donax TaxID=35708 RepID=A0A0A8ZQA2_ARUDO